LTESDDREIRWEYRLLWRYGALLLAAVGLLAMGFGAAGVSSAAISLTLIPIGFICLVAGVVLPRIEGKLTVGPSHLSADMVAVHTLDQLTLTKSAPAVVLREVQSGEGLLAIEAAQPQGAVTMGDVWDALDAAGVGPGAGAELLNHQAEFEAVGLGSAYFRLADGTRLKMPNRGVIDYGAASGDLLTLLASWGIQPTASGRYPVPSDPAYRWVSKRAPFFVVPGP
jgi:hypothetical protein